MIDAKRIEEMKQLSSDATSAPWEWRTDSHDCEELYSWNDDEVITASCGQNVGFLNVSEINGEFIAEARQFVPDIIAAYEAQAEEIVALRKTLIDIYEYTSDLTIVQTITRRHHDIPLEAE